MSPDVGTKSKINWCKVMEIKGILILIICGFMLTGCHSMQKLRVNYKPTGEDSSNYYQDKEGIGHNENVKYSVVDATSSVIEIPIKYNVKSDPVPEKLPKKLETYRNLLDSVGQCEGYCKLSSDLLTLDVRFRKRERESCPTGDAKTAIFVIPFAWPAIPFYINSCTGVDIVPSQSFRLDSPFKSLNKGLGITVDWRAYPDYIELDCDSKSCVARDKKGNIVNQILITKNIRVNTKKLKQLLAEDAKEEEEQERRWRQKQRLRGKECPKLYRKLYWAQQTGYIDPIVGMQTAQRFEELDCGFWLNQQIQKQTGQYY